MLKKQYSVGVKSAIGQEKFCDFPIKRGERVSHIKEGFMKKSNIFKLVGIIAFIAIIGFSMAGCNSVDEPEPEPEPKPETPPTTDPILNGTWVGSGTCTYDDGGGSGNQTKPYGTLTIDGKTWTGSPSGSTADSIAFAMALIYAAAEEGSITDLTVNNGEIKAKVSGNEIVQYTYIVEGNTLTIRHVDFNVTYFVGVKGGGSEDHELTGTIAITPTGPVTTGTELTATYSGEEEVSFQWKNGETNVGTDSNNYTPEIAGSYTVTVSAQGFSDKTSAAVTVTAPEWQTGDVWLKTKESVYTVTSGVVGEVKSEATTEWIIYRYASNTKYEQKYYMTTDPASGETTYHVNRDGLNGLNYLEGFMIINGNNYPMGIKRKEVYDSDTGLMVVKSTPVLADGTDGNPTEYTITLLSNIGGVKTYKRTSNNAINSEEIYKIKGGEIIEREDTDYSYTNIYTLPTDPVILAKLPDFRLEGMKVTSDDSIYNNRYQEVTVLSNDDSALVIQVKEYGDSWGDENYKLRSQTDIRYEKFTFPIEPSGE